MINLEEANVSHLKKKFDNYDIAIISASRDSYSNEEKRKKNTELKNDLMNSPYEIITTVGGYVEDGKDVNERSFFVVNYGNYDENKTKAFEDFMFNLCAKYNQDSIFIKTNNFSAGIYDSNRKPKDFGAGDEINKNNLQVKSDLPFYTRINGTKFTFESTKSKFRQLVENILADFGYYL